ncbi:helix-turn-helix transcriptional regulator [Melioribacteraceae bacterium 4301-Me]|uniref:helix-turn-helix transcriptional regulator n=1 Tax=Pyranulibacter aquaticus TaxID=3163344 RepID=UPI00359A6C8D
MKDFKIKFKRQCEILGIILHSPNTYKITELEDMFGVNSLTIKRDLQELRSLGISIHSKKGKGVSVFQKINDDLIKNLIMQYVGVAVNQSSYNKATNLMVNKLHYKALSFIIILQRCIESNLKVKIEYEKPEEKKIEERILDPYCIFQSENNWRLLANHENIIKQFLLNKIKSVQPLNKKFKPIGQNKIDEIFSTSFKSWLGNERYLVKLKFLPPWSERIKPSQLMESQKVIENPDGSIFFETEVNSLKEIASWIVSRGKGVIVIEPPELKKIVIDTANGVLENYK